MLGNSMQLAGEFFGTWRAWDGIRALDYLLTRPEVDATRIGITGNSGGGTLTSYINSLDERFTMAAPSCFVTTYVHNIENEEPQDSEQIPPRFLGLGLDVADFFIARAPRPVMLLGQKNDFFDPRGLLETYGEVRKIYSLLGAENNVEYFIGPDGHGYHRKNREAMHRFFSKHSGMRLIENEGDIKLEDRTNLQCTDRGQVNLSMKNCRKVFEFTQQKAESLRVSRKTKTKAELESAVRSLLNIKPVDATPMYRKLKPTDNPDFFISRFAVETEPEIQAILFSLSSKQKSGAPRLFLDAGISANLYVPHLSSREDINNGEFDFTAGDRDAYALDPRGGGESTPLSCGMQDFFSPYDSDYFYACIGNMLGSPYLGGKVFDILQTLRLLKDYGYSDIHLIGRGLGSITCAFAAFLSGDVKKVTLKNALTSYHELAMCPSYKWPLSHMIHGVLKHFDLPDIYACLDEKNIAIIDPWDEKMEKKQEAN
jgi:hypothetical protein